MESKERLLRAATTAAERHRDSRAGYREAVLTANLAGCSYRQIADAIGLSVAATQELIERSKLERGQTMP